MSIMAAMIMPMAGIVKSACVLLSGVGFVLLTTVLLPSTDDAFWLFASTDETSLLLPLPDLDSLATKLTNGLLLAGVD